MGDNGNISKFKKEAIAGGIALDESRYLDAISHFQTALRLGAPSIDEEAVIRCNLSEALEKPGRHVEQLAVVKKYEDLSEFSRLSEPVHTLVLLRLGWSYTLNDDVPRGIALFKQALQEARRADDQAAIGEACFGLGRAYSVFSEIRIARDYYSSALEHYRNAGNWRKIADAYVNLGYVHTREGDYGAAVNSLQQGLAIIGAHDAPDLIGRAHWYLAVSFDSLGNTASALASWEKCVESFRRSGNTIFLALNENNFAMQLIRACEWDRAEQVIRAAISAVENCPTLIPYGGMLDTLAQLLILRGDLVEAERLLDESVRVLSSIKNGEWAEAITRTTIGRLWLAKDQPRCAIENLERAVDIATRRGEQQDLPEAQLWLSEALLVTGDINRARDVVESVRSHQRRAPNMLMWGLMMRMAAKIAAAQGQPCEAIHLLAQSSSVYALRKNLYEYSVNRLLLAGWMEAEGRSAEAVSNATAALAEFERLGATLDAGRASAYLASLNSWCVAPSNGAISLLSDKTPFSTITDDHITARILQASVLPDLMIYEMAEIARNAAGAAGALVLSIRESGATHLIASVRLDESEAAERMRDVAGLSPFEYERNGVYSLSDNKEGRYLMQLVGQAAPAGASLKTLLMLVEQGLEMQWLRARNHKPQVFNAARLLAEVKLPGFICASRAMHRVLELIDKIRSSDVTVLITGESGTGKDMIARLIHGSSVRRAGKYLPVNCAASPRDLIDSQLFGFRKGAFTGARADSPGIIRNAEGGTLFLDEIGCMPLDLQPKLLRFLQEREIMPIGEHSPVQVDVRAIAATNSDLEAAVAEGSFREDLFYRLNVYRIEVPPLRERKEEVGQLLTYYMTRYMAEAGKRDIALSEEAVDLMVIYAWPGNVRQLCNEVRRLVVNSHSGAIITADLLSHEILQSIRKAGNVSPAKTNGSISHSDAGQFDGMPLAEAVDAFERALIERALSRAGGNVSRAARGLGIGRRTIYAKMERLNLYPDAQ